TYLLLYHTTLPNPACKITSAFSTGFTLFHRQVIAGISIITYLRVCRQKNCDTGRYDWKLFLPVLIISVVISVLALDSYGPVIY
ncbi:9367_t:CDS:2, partial [Scutellospora calospora]